MSLLARPRWHLNPGAWSPHSFLLRVEDYVRYWRGRLEKFRGDGQRLEW